MVRSEFEKWVETASREELSEAYLVRRVIFNLDNEKIQNPLDTQRILDLTYNAEDGT